MDLLFKILAAVVSLVSLSAALYNLVTARSNAKQLAKERHDAERLDRVCLQAAALEQRVNGIDHRLGSFEQRIEKRIDQMASDISKVKEMFTDYLIKNH